MLAAYLYPCARHVGQRWLGGAADKRQCVAAAAAGPAGCMRGWGGRQLQLAVEHRLGALGAAQAQQERVQRAMQLRACKGAAWYKQRSSWKAAARAKRLPFCRRAYRGEDCSSVLRFWRAEHAGQSWRSGGAHRLQPECRVWVLDSTPAEMCCAQRGTTQLQLPITELLRDSLLVFFRYRCSAAGGSNCDARRGNTAAPSAGHACELLLCDAALRCPLLR